MSLEKQRHQYEQRLQEAQQQMTVILQQNVQLQSQRDQGHEKVNQLEADLQQTEKKFQSLQAEHQK